MTFALDLRRGAALAVAGLAVDGVVLLVLVHRGIRDALPLAIVPAAALLLARLAEGSGWPLLAVALALPMSWSTLTSPLPLGAGHVYPADIVVVLTLATWALSRFQRPDRRGRLRWPRTPVLGLPFVAFSAVVVVALLRGHAAYGATLYGQPTRLFVYAGIGVALGGVDLRLLHRIVTVVFYAGGVSLLLQAAYYIATGGSQSQQVDLSTGGTRVLAISASAYLAGTLFLALLNLQLDRHARRRLVHVAMAVLAAVGVLLGFGRAVIFASFVVVLLLLLAYRRVRGPLLGPLALLLPLLLLCGFLFVRAAPQVEQAIVRRVSSPVQSDANVIWREKANEAVLSQVRSSPYVGVGFGRGASFEMLEETGTDLPVPVQIDVGQDPHDGYLMLLAAGGAVLLGCFALVLGVYAWDCRRCFRSTTDPRARVLVLWAVGTAFVFLFNAASGVEFENPSFVLTLWTLFLIPAAACRPGREAA